MQLTLNQLYGYSRDPAKFWLAIHAFNRCGPGLPAELLKIECINYPSVQPCFDVLLSSAAGWTDRYGYAIIGAPTYCGIEWTGDSDEGNGYYLKQLLSLSILNPDQWSAITKIAPTIATSDFPTPTNLPLMKNIGAPSLFALLSDTYKAAFLSQDAIKPVCFSINGTASDFGNSDFGILVIVLSVVGRLIGDYDLDDKV